MAIDPSSSLPMLMPAPDASPDLAGIGCRLASSPLRAESSLDWSAVTKERPPTQRQLHERPRGQRSNRPPATPAPATPAPAIPAPATDPAAESPRRAALDSAAPTDRLHAGFSDRLAAGRIGDCKPDQTARITLRPEPPRYLISDLCTQLESYLPPDQIREVYRAYLFSAEAHQGQERQSGEAYIFHPLAVTRILAEMRMDYQCLMAALLHDVIEDTYVTKEILAREFNDEIAELVDGVSKLTQIKFKTRADAQAASFRKMMLAMTRDIRVILIKLADRLHNMRTLDAMAPEKRRRISRETLDIYAPIAYRLGINRLRLELEDLGFRHHWPWRHAVLEHAVRAARQNQHEMVATVENAVRQRLAREQIEGEVYGREKHLYSVYRKMEEKSRAFRNMVDFYAFRVVVDRVDTCYRVLGLVHALYNPVPGRFKDYIAIPKSNGYQALHTVLSGPHGVPLEMQIRTHDMDRVAAAGIAAHWLYKTGMDGGASALAQNWLSNLIDLQRETGDSHEFLEQVKIDLFPDEVYVFTPKGAILVLPKGATVVDFAYAIHSGVGNSCVAARIDRQLAPLRTPLRSGQSVEIITAPGAKPNAAWLNFVVTGKARANIRGYLKNLQQTEAEALGRRMLSAALATLSLDLERVGEPRLMAYANEVGLGDLSRLLAEIGLGNRLPVLVARRLFEAIEAEPTVPAPPPARAETSNSNDASDGDHGTPPIAVANPSADGHTSAKGLAIRGTEGMVVNFARCCQPIPGDPITGLFSPGRGIVVHCSDCRNLGEFQSRRDTWLDVEWAPDPKAEFTTEIRVEASNRRGALATIAAAIAEEGSNIETVQSRDKDGQTTTLDFLVKVRGRTHVATIMRRLRQIPMVIRITRLSNAVRGVGASKGR